MIHIVDNITSTNDWLAKYYSEVDDTIIAIKQSKGKGRYGRNWISYKGNLFATIFHEFNLSGTAPITS